MAGLATGGGVLSGALLPPSQEITYDASWREIARTAAPFVFPWRVDAPEKRLRERQVQAKDDIIMAHHFHTVIADKGPPSTASIALILKVLTFLPGDEDVGAATATRDLAKDLLRSCSWADAERYVLFFYHCMQSEFITMAQMVRVLDLVSEARGQQAREDMQYGAIMRSINGRSAPGPQRELDASRRREKHPNAFSFLERRRLMRLPYCQLESCHAMEHYDQGVVLERCNLCGGVSYCCEEHQKMDKERHTAWCSRLAAERMLRAALPEHALFNLTRGIQFVPRAIPSGDTLKGYDRDECLPPHNRLDLLTFFQGRDATSTKTENAAHMLDCGSFGGWEGYFRLRRDATARARSEEAAALANLAAAAPLTEATSAAIDSRKDATADLDSFFQDSALVEYLRTDSLSSVLTVAHSLHRLGLGAARELTLWLLGAAQEEDQPWDELFVWLPETEAIQIVMVGPQMTPGPNTFHMDILPETADSDKSMKRSLCVRKIFGCLHELPRQLLTSTSRLSPPSAIFALNSGAIFYPSWSPTLAMIVKGHGAGHEEGASVPAAPLVVTAWMQPEALGVRELLIGLGGSPVPGFDLSANAWSSLIPQDPNDDHGTVPFNNRYVMAFERRVGQGQSHSGRGHH